MNSEGARARARKKRQERRKKRRMERAKATKPPPTVSKRSELNLRGDAPRIGSKPDPIEHPDGHTIAVMSWVAPHSTPQRCKNIAVNFHGSFATEEKADAYIKKLYAANPDFDIHKVRLGHWLVIPPPVSQQMAVPMKYNQEKLDEIMAGYYKRQESQRRQIEDRVKKAKEAAKREVKKRGLKTMDELAEEHRLTDEMREYAAETMKMRQSSLLQTAPPSNPDGQGGDGGGKT